MPKHHIQVSLIDRSDPDQVVLITKDKERRTRLDELRRSKYGGRSDIVLVNFWNGDGECVQQLCAWPTQSGEPTGPAMEWLSKDELTKARELNRAIIETARIHPEFNRYLKGA